MLREKSCDFLEGRGSTLYLGHTKLICYIGFNQKTSGFYIRFRGLSTVENDQPLGDILVPPQFGIKLLIMDAFLEECASVWGNK